MLCRYIGALEWIVNARLEWIIGEFSLIKLSNFIHEHYNGYRWYTTAAHHHQNKKSRIFFLLFSYFLNHVDTKLFYNNQIWTIQKNAICIHKFTLGTLAIWRYQNRKLGAELRHFDWLLLLYKSFENKKQINKNKMRVNLFFLLVYKIYLSSSVN